MRFRWLFRHRTPCLHSDACGVFRPGVAYRPHVGCHIGSPLWDGGSFLISTPAASQTARNLLTTDRARFGIGPIRHGVLIEGIATAVADHDISPQLGDAFANKTGFDPRERSTPYQHVRIRPVRFQAWREANELDGRDCMQDGAWINAE